MSLTERPIDAVSLDHELAALKQAVTVSRRNHWQRTDVIEPEFENFLAALTKPAHPAASAAPAWRSHRNSWREVIDQTS